MKSSRDVGDLIGLALWRWGCTSLTRFRWVARRTCHIGFAELRRLVRERRMGAPIPRVVAVSPTMRCNYECGGCYSRGRPTENELTTDELDALFTEATDLGVISIVVTGGEPLFREGLLEIIGRYRRLLFVVITNGSLMTDESATRLVSFGNVIPLVSSEGFPEDTDERRRSGAHEAAIAALKRLREADACFGFAAMNTTANTEHVASDRFIDRMSGLGCALGFLTEYVPVGRDERPEWLLDEQKRAAFRERVLKRRRHERLVLIQFPHDEYGEDNLCSAAGRSSIHISSTGDVEPCPFVPLSCDNIREGGLAAACRSDFLRSIRERPHLLRRERHACALFEHRTELEATVRELGGRDRSPRSPR